MWLHVVTGLERSIVGSGKFSSEFPSVQIERIAVTGNRSSGDLSEIFFASNGVSKRNVSFQHG